VEFSVIATSIGIHTGDPVQEIPYELLKPQLLEARQVLDFE
jgi:hypothetical protein